jgi:uncharacterized 2Fe-2S/4Fe-4S cluster protein (DUF4445 family)
LGAYVGGDIVAGMLATGLTRDRRLRLFIDVAGEGAKIAALSLRERAEAHSILREVQYVELSGRTDFNDAFVDQLAFPG